MNQTDSKLNGIEGKLQILLGMVEMMSSHPDEANHKINVEELVSLPLKTIDEMKKLQVDLQDENFFNSMVHSSKMQYLRLYLPKDFM